MLPAVLAGGDSPPLTCRVIGGDMGAILQTIRTLESGGRYDAQAPGSTASGAYQFTDPTWNNYGSYRRAVDAPPDVQDAKAIEHVTNILAANGNDVGTVSVVWYIGHVPIGDEWNRVPFPGSGNVLTPRQYREKWMDIYLSIAPLPADPNADLTNADLANVADDAVSDEPPDAVGDLDKASAFCAGGSVEPLPGGWSLPGPRNLLTIETARRPHHDYAAWDWGIPAGTPIYAVRRGTITSVTNYPHNWFDAGCQLGGSCSRCGIGVTITDDTGTRWSYCHGTSHTITGPGQIIEAGTQVMWSGNSGRSTGPHLHFSIRTPDGVHRCPQPLLESLLINAIGVAPASLPAQGCNH